MSELGIRIEGLRKRYGEGATAVDALKDVNLTVAPGEVVGFTGSYLAPTNCSVADTLTATAASRCGVAVSSVASAARELVFRANTRVW